MKLNFLTDNERQLAISRAIGLIKQKFYNFNNPDGELVMQNKVQMAIDMLTAKEVEKIAWTDFMEILGYCVGNYGEPSDEDGERMYKIYCKCEVHYAHLFGTEQQKTADFP